MKISVIIATRNRREDIRMVINAFNRQTHPEKEIIVVDNESTDGTREMMRDEFPGVKYLWLPDNHDIRAINIGIELSDGEIIWRTDSDSHPESDDAFKTVVSLFGNHEDIDIISMQNIEVRLNYEPTDWYPYPIDKVNVPDTGYQSNYFNGSGAAIRRKVYARIGGFWEYGMEELDFCTRAIIAGFSIRYYPNIRILHYSSPSEQISDFRWLQLSKQLVRYQWRYFPFMRALGRSTVVFFFQMLNGLFSGLSPLVLLEGIFQMEAVAVHSYRKERNIAPKEKRREITLGKNIFYNYTRYIIPIFKRRLRKLTGK